MDWHTFSLHPVTQRFSVSFITFFSNSPPSAKPVSLVQPQKRITASGKSECSPVPPDTPRCEIRVMGTRQGHADLKGWLSGNRSQAVPVSCPELPNTRGPCWCPELPYTRGPCWCPELPDTRGPCWCPCPAPLQGGTSESGVQGAACWCGCPLAASAPDCC